MIQKPTGKQKKSQKKLIFSKKWNEECQQPVLEKCCNIILNHLGVLLVLLYEMISSPSAYVSDVIRT